MGGFAHQTSLDGKKTKQTKVSNTSSIYEFENQDFRINSFCKGTEMFGKHYLVTFDNKSRNYTSCLCLNENSRVYRKNLINLYNKEVLGLKEIDKISYSERIFRENSAITQS